MKVLRLVFLFIFASSSMALAQNIDRKFVRAEISASGDLSVIVSDGIYTITPFNSKITQTTFVPSGQKFIEDSHAVILSPVNSKPQFIETKSTILFKTSGIEVNIQKSPFQISYIYKGKEIISEKLGYKTIDNGEAIQFNLDEDEVLFGGGARALDMNRRGNRLELYNKAHYGYETHS